MSLSLHTIKPNKGARKSAKRVGRGLGSTGTYSGKGVKGQASRAGASGLQLKGIRALMLSIPKQRGFKSQKPKAKVLNVGDLATWFKDGDLITPDILSKRGIIEKAPGGIKILGTGDIAIKVTIKGCKVSASAAEKVTAAGGNIQ